MRITSGASKKSSACLNSRGSKPYAVDASSNPASHHLCSGGARVIVLAGLVWASRSLRGRPDSRNLKLTHTTAESLDAVVKGAREIGTRLPSPNESKSENDGYVTLSRTMPTGSGHLVSQSRRRQSRAVGDDDHRKKCALAPRRRVVTGGYFVDRDRGSSILTVALRG